MALIDGNKIIWSAYKDPAAESSRFLSFSVGKTVTSMGVGKAICAGKLKLSTVAQDIVPELMGTDLGRSTVRDLLMMSSGTWIGNKDSSIQNAEQTFDLDRGKMNRLDLLLTPKVNTAEQNSSGVKRMPGEWFIYHSTDPELLGILINKTTGMSYAKWIEKEVLMPAGIKNSAVIGQDWDNYGNAAGNVRMTLDDWIRFAYWVKKNEGSADCFGKYVDAASRTQIKNISKISGLNFDGYGYLIWTDNRYLRDSYWAVGYGGQRIAWNHRNQRMLIVFSGVENYMDNLYRLYADWAALPDSF